MIGRFRARTPRGGAPYARPHLAYLYILPGFAVYAVFVLVPVLGTFRYSLFEWTGFSEPTYLGLGNYLALLQDGSFWNALGNNVFFVIFYTALPVVLGLLLTSLLARGRLRGMVIFRTGLFIPQVMSAVVVGTVWRWLFAVNGPINAFLRQVGLENAVRPWLGDFTWAPYATGLVGTWVEYGLCMVLFIAGAQSINEDLYDAARVDGANAWRQFLHVTLPGLQRQLLVGFVLTFIAALRVFDLVFVLTKGGPGKETEVVSMLIYQEAFEYRQAGYATTMAVVLSAIIVIVSATVFRLQARGDEGE